MKVVLANGVFDLFHIGHLRYLQQARQMGEILIVAVTRDEFVNKGPDRPLYNEGERLSVITGLRCVTAAVLVNSSIDALQKIKPNIFVKGKEYEGKIRPEDEDFCRQNNIQILFTDSEFKRPHDRLRSS